MPDPDPDDARTPAGVIGLSVLIGLLLGLIALILWVPSQWLEQVMRLEQEGYRQALGERSAATVLDLAWRWCAIRGDQGAVFAPGQSQLPGLQPSVLLDGLSPAWLAERSRASGLLIELAALRAALLAAWGPALLLLLIGGVLEGHWRWRVRQLGFDYPSPVARQASQAGLALVAGLSLVVIFLPLSLHPLEIPLLALIAVRLIGAGITHLPKQL